MNHNHLRPPGRSGMIEPTKVEPTKAEQLITSIVFKTRLARECKEQEQRASSERNGYECEALNAVIDLAKELVLSLGNMHATRLATELGTILGWDQVRGVTPAKTSHIQDAPGSIALSSDSAVAWSQKGAQGPACEPCEPPGGGGGSRVPPGG